MIIEILLALLVLYVCYILGYIFLGFFKVKLNFREEAVYSLGLGIGIIGYLVLILGLFGLLYNYIFWMILIITPVVSVKTGKAFFKKLFSFKLKFHWMLIPIFILLLLNLIGALAPPMGWDTQIYHLPTQANIRALGVR